MLVIGVTGGCPRLTGMTTLTTLTTMTTSLQVGELLGLGQANSSLPNGCPSPQVRGAVAGDKESLQVVSLQFASHGLG
jgi:hypothetical protein